MNLVFRRLKFIAGFSIFECIALAFLYLSIGLWAHFWFSYDSITDIKNQAAELASLSYSLKVAFTFMIIFICLWALIFILKSYISIVFLSKYVNRFKIRKDQINVKLSIILTFFSLILFIIPAIYTAFIYQKVFSWNKSHLNDVNVEYINAYQ